MYSQFMMHGQKNIKFNNKLHTLAAIFHGTTPWYQSTTMQTKSPRAGVGQQKDILPHRHKLANKISGSGGTKSTMGITIFELRSSQVRKTGMIGLNQSSLYNNLRQRTQKVYLQCLSSFVKGVTQMPIFCIP